MPEPRRIKGKIDLRKLVERDLGRPQAHGGEARLWRCPFHGERRGHSLVVWADGWRCFGACQAHGDVFDWLKRYRGMNLTDACAYLEHTDLQAQVVLASPRTGGSTMPRTAAPHSSWQATVRQILADAENALWSASGQAALDYLRRRGLRDETILAARLGLIQGRATEWLRLGGLTVPCGIAIPWWVGQELWAVKVRRASRIVKYAHISGSSTRGLYNAAALEGQRVVLLVEGEFDALLAAQECGGQIGVATPGSASNRLDPHWLPLLARCKTLLVAYDRDIAGERGAAQLRAISRRARIVALPFGKDITEFVLGGGSVKQWLENVL